MKLLLVFFLLRPGDGAVRVDERPGFAPVRMSSDVQCWVMQEAVNGMPRRNPDEWYSMAMCVVPGGA
jgi:hypothetical protein